MDKPPFEFGEKVFTVSVCSGARKEVACRICFGKKIVALILGNGEQQPIECEACRNGAFGPTGLETIHTIESRATEGTVTGLTFDRDWSVEVSRYGPYKVTEVYRTLDEAEAARERLHKEAVINEAKRRDEQLGHKKNGHTWSARYHKQAIERLERQIEYHREKLREKKLSKENT